jgi:hypothetical protein
MRLCNKVLMTSLANLVYLDLSNELKQDFGLCGLIFEAPLRITWRLKENNYSFYSARRLMGSRIIESAAYCNQILLAQSYIDRAQNTSVN